MTNPYDDFAQGVKAAIRNHEKRHTERPTKPHTEARWRTVVTLSVRRRDGGLPFRFEFRTPHIGRLDAEMRARAEARRQGLIDWAVLSIEATDGTKTIATP